MPSFRDDNLRTLREVDRLRKDDERHTEETRVHFNSHLEGSEIDVAIELGLMSEADRQDPTVIAEMTAGLEQIEANEAPIAAGLATAGGEYGAAGAEEGAVGSLLSSAGGDWLQDRQLEIRSHLAILLPAVLGPA